MPLFQTGDIDRHLTNGEQNIAVERPFLVDRISLDITAGAQTYFLPDYVLSIKRVTWLGYKLDPMGRRNQRDVFQAANQVGKPFWYIFNNIAQLSIQLFPVPGTSVGVVGNPWSGTDIANGVIVEFWRAPDGSSFVIPPEWRTIVLKQYTAHMLSLMDGSGSNVKQAKIYGDQWTLWKGLFYIWLDEMITKPRKYVVSELVSNNYFPGSPVLPIDRFGTAVDEGY